MKLKELMEQKQNYFKGDHIKTHIRKNGVDNGITDFYTNEYLLENYADCEAEIVYYEKDYGFDEETGPIIEVRNYLAIDIKEEK